MQLVDRIAAHRSELTPAEIRVAEFMADNPHGVGYLSALKPHQRRDRRAHRP